VYLQVSTGTTVEELPMWDASKKSASQDINGVWRTSADDESLTLGQENRFTADVFH
jgi:hypothetical protein